MNKLQKKQLDDLLDLLKQAQESVINFIKDGNRQDAATVLEDCQTAAISVGQTIDENVGEGTETVGHLERYCELVFSLHEQLMSDEEVSASKVTKHFDKFYRQIMSAYNREVQAKKLAVFLPYKASMWDSLESVWKRIDKDPEWDAVVVPIPYYDKNTDGTFKEYHYEGTQYPKDVPVVFYEGYDLKEIHPEEIYIHNPYDDINYVTSVHPAFYSSELKNYTDRLIYIPYFVLREANPNEPDFIEALFHFAASPGVINSHETWVQSENMRLCYIKALVDFAGENTRSLWEAKIKAVKSPKIEKIENTKIEDIDIPEGWKEKLYKKDGSPKKVIFYNTTLSTFLQYTEQMIEKIPDVLALFKSKQEDITLLWRPHPLLKATLSSMRPEYSQAYEEIVGQYITDDYGIYDDTPDLDRAIVLSDAYYGDYSSVANLFQAVKKPVMYQNVHIRSELVEW